MKVIKYIFIGLVLFGFIMSLKPCKSKTVKEEPIIIIHPNYNNNGMDKADSG